MKNKILAVLTVAGMATSVFGQGLFMSNIGNSGAVGATANGLVYIDSGTVHVADLYNNNLGVEISAGLTSSSLSPLALGTYTGATDPKGYTAWDLGQFYLGNTVPTDIPGAAAGQAVWIQLNMWFDGPYSGADLFNSYSAAYGGGGYVNLTPILFQQTVSGGGSPPAPPQGFTSMPSVILQAVPEPATFALTGLGLAALLAFRRRK